jgi:hypothetical protein
MRWYCSILFAVLLTLSLAAGCEGKKNMANEGTGPRMQPPPMPTGQTGKPPMNMPITPPPRPDKKGS